MRARVFRLALAAVLLSVPAVAPAASGSPKMERTAPYITDYCKESRRLLRACPSLLPRMSQPAPHWEANLCLVGRAGCQGLAWDDLSLVDAGYGIRPPLWSHVVIYAGRLSHAFSFAYPAAGARPARLDGLFARTRTRAVFLGAFTWNRKKGTVVLAPPFPSGGDMGDHLIFRWREGGVGLALSLHGWEPLSAAFGTLRRMVRSISA